MLKSLKQCPEGKLPLPNGDCVTFEEFQRISLLANANNFLRSNQMVWKENVNKTEKVSSNAASIPRADNTSIERKPVINPKTGKTQAAPRSDATFSQQWAKPLAKEVDPEFIKQSGKIDALFMAPFLLPIAGTALGSIGVTPTTLGTALTTSIPGIPGASLANAGSAFFATDFMLNRAPQIPGQLKRGEYQDAIANTGFGALDLLGAGIISPSLFRNIGNLATNVYNTPFAKPLKDAAIATALSKQLSFGKPRVAYRPITLPRKIDPINRSSVNVQNDYVNPNVETGFGTMGKEEYDDFTRFLYEHNQQAYSRPLVEFKSSRPSSYYSGIGSADDYAEGTLFKERFCPPGSECAKSANAFTNRVYTDITGKPFAVNENAHNAWHMEDQMTRHGGINVTNRPIVIGDRILMGNSVDQSTYVPGYTADPRVRHAGVYAGDIKLENGNTIPVVFESGRNNAGYMNPIFHTFTGKNTVVEAIRPAQFLDNSFGPALADKNIRYAYRNKPSVATYTSDNKNVQSILDKAEDYREKIKRTHDLTNDEFDELLNSLIGIGAQETKLNASLPSSILPKAKIKLQNALLETGLTKPIKIVLNTTKNVGNKISSTASSLPEYPGASIIEMESAKLAKKEGISFNDALNRVKSQYQPKPKFRLSTVEPSKGIFRQKFQTEEGRISGFKDISKDEISNALSQMAENYAKVKKTYPNATPRQLIDITTLMWNSPGKAMNPELVDFYIFGKNNPDPTRFNFDYISKINQFKNRYINIKPRKVEPHLEIFRNSEYPEIQYKTGGKINYLRGYKK